jgi:hypothetical protein
VVASQPCVNAEQESNNAVVVAEEGLKNVVVSGSARSFELNGKTYLRGRVQKQNGDTSSFGSRRQSAGGDETSNSNSGSFLADPIDSSIPIFVTMHESIFLPEAAESSWIALDKLFENTVVAAPETPRTGRHKSAKEGAIYKSKSMLNYMLGYRAFGPSAEAADLILDEHSKLKSADAKKYYLQQEVDQGHLMTVSNILQLGMGLGTSDSIDVRRMTNASLTALRALVGDSETDEILKTLKSLREAERLSGAVQSHGLWTLGDRAGKVDRIVQSALACDPVITDLKKTVHRYNRHGKVLLRSMGALQAALHVAAFTPTFAAPAAETASFLLVMSTGGPEQDKLLREMYLSKRLESRTRMITDKARMAVDAYNAALMADNSVLLASAQALVRQMAGEEMVREVFGSSELANYVGIDRTAVKSSLPNKPGNAVAQLDNLSRDHSASSQVVPKRNPAL